MKAKDITKRSLMLILVAWITFVSVFHAYETTTECAEWIAGTIATIGAGPMLTALVVGGVVVAGGVAVYKIATTDPEDYRSFASGIKQGFQEFVSDQEKQIALEQNSSLSDQEAADIGVANAREVVNGFFDNAITTTKNTAKNISFSAVKYWQLYNKIIGNVADNGITNSDIIIDENTVINGTIVNNTSYTFSKNKTSLGKDCILYDDSYYIQKGTYGIFDSGYQSVDYEVSNVPSDRVRFPFFILRNDNAYGLNAQFLFLDVNRLTGEVITYSVVSSLYYNLNGTTEKLVEVVDKLLALTSFPVLICNQSDFNATFLNNYLNNYKNNLAVKGSSGEAPKTWERTIDNTLSNTKFGEAIQTGRRQLVNEGDHIISVFKEDSIPVNKVGLRENEGIMTGDIGWQIPQTWDDYFGGAIPWPDIVGGTGTIGVPYPDVIPGVLPKDVTVDFPADTDVQDTADYPRNPADEGEGEKPEGIPEKPAQDVFETQGGNFYPAAMDLTNIFPFCIPFDLIYLVEKFDVHGENAPVITIPIIYPQVMANATGTDRYEVIIDFSDFIVLRNILRTFLLLLFIVGLLKITRDLIRG